MRAVAQRGGLIFEGVRVTALDGHDPVRLGVVSRRNSGCARRGGSHGLPVFDCPELFSRLVPRNELVVAAPARPGNAPAAAPGSPPTARCCRGPR